MPKLDAQKSDIPPVTEMVTGGNASHYWENSGIIGNRFKHTLAINVYAWDVWMIYKPGARWNDQYPPAPDFWMHDLWGVNGVPRLNSGVFAGKVVDYLKSIQVGE